MNNERYICKPINGKSICDLVSHVEAFLQTEENMTCQRIACDDPDYIIL